MKVCREQQPAPLYLSLHVAEYNEEAIPFYEKLSFEMVEMLNSHYFIQGEFYGAYFYLYYFEDAKKPVFTWKNISSSTKSIFKIPGCFKIFR